MDMVGKEILGKNLSVKGLVEGVLKYADPNFTFDVMSVADPDSFERSDFYIENLEEIRKEVFEVFNTQKLNFKQFYCLLMLSTEDLNEEESKVQLERFSKSGANMENAKALQIFAVSNEKNSVFIEEDSTLEKINNILA